MKRTRSLIVAGLAAAILCGVAGFKLGERKAALNTLVAKLVGVDLTQAKSGAKPWIFPGITLAEIFAQENSAVTENTGNRPNDPFQNPLGAAHPSAHQITGPLKNPLARIVLPLVGNDPIATVYWYEAINDPNLPAHERQDLIEELNEAGISDYSQPSLDDLPLILNRLMLIEAVGPDAMDAVNADAFAEAYEDLVMLAAIAMGDEEPAP
jgi:hypothetical protein